VKILERPARATVEQPAAAPANCRKIPITLKMPARGILREMAFHGKAGRVKGILVSCCSTRFSSRPFAAVAMPPSALWRSESFRSVHVGRPQFSGADICLSPCDSALREWNLGQAINAVTGTRAAPDVMADFCTRLDAVLELTMFVTREFLLQPNYSLDNHQSDIFDMFQLQYLAFDRFVIASNGPDLDEDSPFFPCGSNHVLH
jgi:hypothetical protein